MFGPANSELEAVDTCSTAKLKTLIQQELKGHYFRNTYKNYLLRKFKIINQTLILLHRLELTLSLENMPENNKLSTLQQFKNSRDQDTVQWL